MLKDFTKIMKIGDQACNALLALFLAGAIALFINFVLLNPANAAFTATDVTDAELDAPVEINFPDSNTPFGVLKYPICKNDGKMFEFLKFNKFESTDDDAVFEKDTISMFFKREWDGMTAWFRVDRKNPTGDGHYCLTAVGNPTYGHRK